MEMRNKPLCSDCGEDKNFSYLFNKARNTWYRCENCGNENVTVRNDEEYDT